MAIQVSKTLKELKKMADTMGVTVTPTGKNGRFMKEDYILPIREHFIKQRYGDINNAPDHFRWIVQNIKSPMLAERIEKLKEEVQREIWESSTWFLEEKMNGARIFIVKDNIGFHTYSRHNSDVDLLPVNFTDKILFPDNFDPDGISETFILDTEVISEQDKLNAVIGKYGVVTETSLQAVTVLLNSDPQRAHLIQRQENIRLKFCFFDCIFYQGQWLFNVPLKERRKLGIELYQKLKKAGFKISPIRSNISNKRVFHKSIINAGLEGTVAKRIDGLYLPDTMRRDDGWIKIKRSVGEMLSLNNNIDDIFEGHDTVDGWISGFEPATEGKSREGYIGNILVSTYIQRPDGSFYEHCIAKISGIDMKLRKDMTEVVGGQPTLKASYYNRIVEVDGSGISPRSKRLNNAVFLGFRYDKDKDSCVLTEEFLNSMIL